MFFTLLVALNSSYMGWDYTTPKTVVMGVGIHSFEWLFVRIAPFVFVGGSVGAFITRKK